MIGRPWQKMSTLLNTVSYTDLLSTAQRTTLERQLLTKILPALICFQGLYKPPSTSESHSAVLCLPFSLHPTEIQINIKSILDMFYEDS